MGNEQFAILRMDRFQKEWTFDAVTITKVVASVEEARSEIARLNTLQAERGVDSAYDYQLLSGLGVDTEEAEVGEGSPTRILVHGDDEVVLAMNRAGVRDIKTYIDRLDSHEGESHHIHCDPWSNLDARSKSLVLALLPDDWFDESDPETGTHDSK